MNIEGPFYNAGRGRWNCYDTAHPRGPRRLDYCRHGELRMLCDRCDGGRNYDMPRGMSPNRGRGARRTGHPGISFGCGTGPGVYMDDYDRLRRRGGGRPIPYSAALNDRYGLRYGFDDYDYDYDVVYDYGDGRRRGRGRRSRGTGRGARRRMDRMEDDVWREMDRIERGAHDLERMLWREYGA